MQPDKEFITSFVILGGIIFAGLMVTIGLTMLGIAVYRKKKETKLTFNGKERSNGHDKTITRGKW